MRSISESNYIRRLHFPKLTSVPYVKTFTYIMKLLSENVKLINGDKKKVV